MCGYNYAVFIAKFFPLIGGTEQWHSQVLEIEVAMGLVTGREYRGYWSCNHIIRGIYGVRRSTLTLATSCSVAITKVVTLGNCGILQGTSFTYTWYIDCSPCIKLTFIEFVGTSSTTFEGDDYVGS